MYSQEDIDSAVAEGVLSAQSAQDLHDHVAARRSAPMADEENFRLVSGFNDIFVAIACVLVIVSGIYVGNEALDWLGALLVAVSSWLMAEIFTRRRRMALPSIVLLIAFVGGLGFAGSGLAGAVMPTHAVVRHYPGMAESWTHHIRHPWQEALMALAGAALAAAGALAHWYRFRVAITIAAGIGALVLLALSALAAATNADIGDNPAIAPAALACGLAVFAFAMRWDLSDRERRTQRADVAFWLHLLAAPLIAHPLFYWMGVFAADKVTPAQGIGVLAIYVVFALVALIVDRRALLVSALIYVLSALYSLLDRFGSVEFAMAINTMIIGCALLALSVLWGTLRRAVVRYLPQDWQERLPATP